MVQDVSSILSRRVTCIDGRADVKAILSEAGGNAWTERSGFPKTEEKEKEEVAVLAAGPELLVAAVENASMAYATMHFYRESMEV